MERLPRLNSATRAMLIMAKATMISSRVKARCPEPLQNNLDKIINRSLYLSSSTASALLSACLWAPAHFAGFCLAATALLDSYGLGCFCSFPALNWIVTICEPRLPKKCLQFVGSGHGDGPRTDNFLNADGPQDVNHRLELAGLAGNLHHITFWPDVNNLAPEDIDYPQNLGPGVRLGLYPNQGHLPLHIIMLTHISDLDNVNELMKLLGDLLNDSILAGSHQGQAGNILLKGLGHGEAFNVEAPAAEKACYPGKNSGFILQQYGNGMFHRAIL